MTGDAEEHVVAPAFDPSVCWNCHGTADPDCAKAVPLARARTIAGVARPDAGQALGCAVDVSGSLENATVSIPRCRACRTGDRVRETAGVFATVPSIAVGVGFYLLLNHRTGMDWDSLPKSETLPAVLVVGLGMVVGWSAGFWVFVAIVCLALGATRKRPKADKHFPLVAALLARGWRFSTTD